MLKERGINKLLKKFINLVTFTDLPFRKKFLLFSGGALFWLIMVTAIGWITMFDMSAKSRQMVEVIWPQEKTANIVIRKLRGANISAKNIAIFKDPSVISANYRRAKGTLQDSRYYLRTMLSGGQIIDHNRATGQFSEPFHVTRITDPDKRRIIETVIDDINQLDGIVDEIANIGSANNKMGIEEKIAVYDNLTREAVTIMNDYAINVGKEWQKFTLAMKKRLSIGIISISIIFFISAILSAVFGILISRSLTRPIKAITAQIKALSAGGLNLTKKLEVSSHDEIGTLSNEFNSLMDTIEHVASFKKTIEEDESIEDIYMRLGKTFRDELDITDCIIYEVFNSKNSMKVVYPPEAEGKEIYCERDVQIDCEMCRAKRTGHVVSSLEYPDICKHYIDAKPHVCIPIIVGGNVGGVVQVICKEGDSCDPESLEKKITKARQYIVEAQPVLEAKRLMRTLKESSFKDALTGLYNRRFLEESYEGLVAGIIRRGTVIGLLMCDLDFFKETNDVYGHDVGDMVLKEAADKIKRSVRTSDLVIRYGGEEFLVLLIDTHPEDSPEVAEKIRHAVEETKVKITGGFIQKTISIGISEFPSDTHNFWEAIKYADVALYKAKERGRNRVVRFAHDMWTGDRY